MRSTKAKCPYATLGCSFGDTCKKTGIEIEKCGYYAYMCYLDKNFGKQLVKGNEE